VPKGSESSDQDIDHYVVSVLPGIAFSLHLIESTQQYGVTEVLLSSFMASFIFSVIGAQPLCIAGVTGLHIPICTPANDPHFLKALLLF
jgi:hypothetical protein